MVVRGVILVIFFAYGVSGVERVKKKDIYYSKRAEELRKKGIKVKIRIKRLPAPVIIKRGPRFKFTYNTFNFLGRAHLCSLELFPLSWYIRLGLLTQAGSRRYKYLPHTDFIFKESILIGLQYPARVTPFMDFVLGLGLLHVKRMQQGVNHFIHSLGLDFGLETFFSERILLSLVIGYVRHIYNDVYQDSLNFKVGLGF
jgi:hypothetical protein